MNYFLLFFSIFLETAKTVIANLFSKQELKADRDIFKFNWIFYLGSFAILLCFPSSLPSLYTVIMAAIFAIVTTASQYFCLQALRCGPMSLTTFIQGSNLLIPTFFGMFLGVIPSPYFWPLLALLLVAMALVLVSKLESVRFRWILLSMGTFLFTGGIGIMQTLAKPDEQIPFLQIAFALCALFNFAGQFFVQKKEPCSFSIRSRTGMMAIGSGLAMGAVNRINLYLADPNVMETYIFFPIVNGGLIFLTTVAAMIFFKERLTRKQWIGLVLGIAVLTVIGIV